MKWAMIQEIFVGEIWAQGGDPRQIFPPNIQWAEVPDEVQSGWYAWQDSYYAPTVTVDGVEVANPDLPNGLKRDLVRRAGELTPLQFQLRLTQAERIAIRTSTDPAIVDYRALAALAQSISLVDPITVGGLQLLVAEGILAPERVPEILGYTPE